MPKPPTTSSDRDAVAGNLRLERSAFILDLMRQDGVLAIEAARRFDAGERLPRRPITLAERS